MLRKLLTVLFLVSALAVIGCSGGVTGGEVETTLDDGLSSDFYMKSLSFSTGTMKYPFNPGDWVNYVEVPYLTDSITVTATPNQKWASIYIGEEVLEAGVESSPISLIVGLNTIEIKVIAEDGQELIYTYYITRVSENYAVAKLASLAIEGLSSLTPAFDPEGSNTSFSAQVTTATISLSTAAFADSEGADIEVKVNNAKVTDTSAIALNVGSNTLKVTAIAADGVTKKTYTITIVRQTEATDSNNLAILSIAGGNLDPVFSSSVITYAIDVSSTMNPVNLTAIPESNKSTVTVTVTPAGGSATTVTNLSSITLSPGIVSVIRVTVTPQSGTAKTYTINANSLQGSDNANLSALTAMMGTKSYRPLYAGTFTRGDTYHDPAVTGFNKDKTSYATVIYGFNTVKLVATAEDSSVASIQFAADGTSLTSTFDGGVGTCDVPLVYGGVVKIDITVLAGDDTTTKVYTVYAKLLNIDEFYWGIYGPSLDKSKKDRWEPKPSAGGSKSVSGLVSGTMKWSITLDPTSTINLTNYSDGQQGYIYNDEGFVVNGIQISELDGVTTKDGYNVTKAGTTFYVRTYTGEDVATLGYHIKIDGGETVEASDSYTDINYMGLTNRQIFKTTKPYPFSTSYDWTASWSDGQ